MELAEFWCIWSLALIRAETDPTWEEAAEAEGCFEELPPEDLDPEFGEAEFDEGDGMLDADAHELLKNVFPQ